MKSILYLVGLFLFVGFLRGADKVGFELRGLFREESRTICSLLDLASGRTAWVEVGQRFGDYQLVAFDPKAEVATVRSARGEQFEVRLAAAPIRRVQPSEVLSREQAKAELLGRFARLGESRRATPAEIAALGGAPSGPKLLSDLSDAEMDKMLNDLVLGQPLPTAAAEVGAPVRWVPFKREALPIELSFNLTDADLVEINNVWRGQFDAQLGPLLKNIREEVRRSVIAPR